VDFALTDEQELLRATARQFVADVCPPERAKDWDERSTVPRGLFEGMAELGWFALPFAEEDGGDGGGPVELILIAEELGRASFDVAMCYIGVLIPGLTVFRWGSEAQRAFIRERVMTGRHRLAVGLSEPDSGSDAAALRTQAEDRGDHFLVNGQ
jgi:alkylation response protein AidB-like acyl-CoA dehydrogenase